MKYKKMVDFDALSEEEKEAIELGDKTEEDLIKEWEQQEEEERKRILEEAQKAKELAENYKIRAEKAESRTKEVKETPKNDLTYLDTIALVKADVSDEDISDIMDYASIKKISVAEALKSSVVKSLLAERKEERQTAEVTSESAKRPGQTSRSASELLHDASTGQLPKSDEDIERLVEAQLRSKSRR
jgi:hypothetical protein